MSVDSSQASFLDDGKRGRVGVVVSIREEPDGGFRLFVDDVEAQSLAPYPSWRANAFVTTSVVSRPELFDFKLSDSRAQGLGQFLLARLGALQSVVEGR